MSKIKKALYITGLVLGIAVLVLYVIFPAQTEYYFNCVKDFINRPLPIVGISLVIIGEFAYKIFVLTKFGQGKLKEVKEENKKLQDRIVELEEERTKLREEIVEVKEFAESVGDKVDKGFILSKNVKINALVKQEEEEDE